MKKIRKLASDFLGLSRVCGTWLALRWLLSVVVNIPSIRDKRNLQPADDALGQGPFRVRHPAAKKPFLVTGPSALSGIREMYARDVYLKSGTLEIKDGDVVVDLGANMGNFTNLALAHGEAVRVFAVEPSQRLNEVFNHSVSLNGWLDRVVLINAFIGMMGGTQHHMKEKKEYRQSKVISENEFIKIAAISRVDFLKCDIEGGEFGIFNSDSQLLRMTQKLAIEIHHFAGDVDAMIETFKKVGFEVAAIQRDPDGTATVLARRPRNAGEH